MQRGEVTRRGGEGEIRSTEKRNERRDGEKRDPDDCDRSNGEDRCGVGERWRKKDESRWCMVGGEAE